MLCLNASITVLSITWRPSLHVIAYPLFILISLFITLTLILSKRYGAHRMAITRRQRHYLSHIPRQMRTAFYCQPLPSGTSTEWMRWRMKPRSTTTTTTTTTSSKSACSSSGAASTSTASTRTSSTRTSSTSTISTSGTSTFSASTEKAEKTSSKETFSRCFWSIGSCGGCRGGSVWW